jgi:hypothetical protein
MTDNEQEAADPEIEEQEPEEPKNILKKEQIVEGLTMISKIHGKNTKLIFRWVNLRICQFKH